jgi:hypothetical protein
MNRPLRLALVAAFLLAPLAARADEPPHFDFVHGLRERHFFDLALDYLHKLQARTDLPPEIAARLPLEIARTQLDSADATPDIGQRLSLYLESRKQFEEFLNKNPKSPLANQARLDLAHVAVLQGKTQLSRALREQDPATRIAEAERARPLLQDAGKQLEAVVPLLDKQAADYPEPQTPAQKAEKKDLEDARLQARLDVALNLFDLAQTYVDTDKDEVLKERSKIIGQAIDKLQKGFDADEKNPLYWVGRAWLGRFLDESGDPPQARKRFAEVLDQTGKQAAAGQRLARYFRMLVIKEGGDPSIKDRPKEIKDEATKWLKDYAAYLSTPEGFGVRYLLAEADVQLTGEQKVTPAIRKALFTEAKGLLKQLEETDNDFMVQARKVKIAVIKEEGGLKGDVKTLPTFDDCYVRAQYEDAVIEEEEKKGKLTEEQRKEHLKTIVEALNRGLTLAPKEKAVPPDDLNNAKTALAFAYMTGGDLVGAARVGEELAKLPNRPSQSGRGAIYALHSYAQIVADPEKAKVAADDAKEYRDKLRALAEFTKKNWPNDTPGDVARHELGLLDIREENYPAAVEDLSGIRPGYGGAIYAKYQLAMAALEADKRSLKPAGADKRPWEQQALAALDKLPELPKNPDPATAYIYAMARLKQGQLLYAAKKYDEIGKIADPLLQRLPDLKFDTEDQKEQARSGVSTLSLLAKYGKASEAYGAKRYDEVIGLLGPVLGEADKLPEFKTNPQLRWAILGLLLRSDIQAQKLDDAQKVLDVLQKLSEEGGLGGGGIETLKQLAQLLKGQVEEIRRKQPDQLPNTVTAFSKFLDTLTKQQEKGGALPPDALLILQDCYSSLGNHKRAADMLKAYPEPKDNAPQKERETWQVIQVMHLRQIRQDGQTDEAKKELEKLLATPWGPKNLELQKEKVFLLMEPKKYMTAAKGWDQLVKLLVSKITQPGMKDEYFECYYWLVVCLYKHAQEQEGPKQAAGIKQAASFITTLEAKWPDLGGEESKARFMDLLDKEPPLKEQYEQLKKAAQPAQAGGNGNGNP